MTRTSKVNNKGNNKNGPVSTSKAGQAGSETKPEAQQQPMIAPQPSAPELFEQGLFPLDFQPRQLVQGFIFSEIFGKPRCRRGR